MVRLTFKWNFALFCYSFLIIATNSLPITTVLPSEVDYNGHLASDVKDNLNVTQVEKTNVEKANVQRTIGVNQTSEEENITSIEEDNLSVERVIPRSSVLRPGLRVDRYVVTLTHEEDEDVIRGRAVLTVTVTTETRPEPIRLHCDGLDVHNTRIGMFSDAITQDANSFMQDGALVIIPPEPSTNYVVIIEYTVPIRNDGTGIFASQFMDVNYMAMNLHPINARRVFPCIDEPDHASSVVLSFNDIEYENIVTNSLLEDDSESHKFMPLLGPVHTWGMVAHNLVNINVPTANVLLYVRPGIVSQDQQASATINFVFTHLNEWTDKQYFEIILNQEERMHIFALPDTNRDWYALSTVCIWEPYVLMEIAHSVRQRTTAIMTIAEAIARQWFGYAIHPQNFRFQWVLTGLGKYAAFQVLKEFQTDPADADVNLIDMKTIFTTEVIQESLLRDSFSSTRPMQPAENIFNEPDIRDVVNGLVRYKAPAIMHMFRNVLGDEEEDYIQHAAKVMLSRDSLTAINNVNFYDAINSKWLFEGNEIVPNVADFARPWVELRGYPLVHVGLRQGGLLLTQEHFSFQPAAQTSFLVPITYTTGAIGDFENVHPVMMLDVTTTLGLALDHDDYVLFNIQGQGYYRVNYDGELWGRIIEALYDEERREKIHPLNRATLLDDSLILARAGKIDYGTAFQIVLAMELETEYAPWKAFVRNMNFLRKHLVFYVEEQFLDPDIYLRMVRRTIDAFAEEIGFEPDPNLNVPAMTSLTRGLVMEHACLANYERCLAAAIDWFYNPNNMEEVNPNIPHELRPAVYCTMMKEGDEEVYDMLMDRMEIEPTHYERLVILKALACSQDEEFISKLLHSTIDDDDDDDGRPYGVEERVIIFNAIAESNHQNTKIALSFLIRNIPEIRQKYGGPDKLEDLLFVLADNLVDPVLLEQFTNWINSVSSNLDDSLDVARRAREQALQVMDWRESHLGDIYEWIDENGAPTLIVSSILITLSLCLAIFNR